jgi:hypothetical protein
MSGRKVSQAELIGAARRELEATIAACRQLANEAARLGRAVDAAASRAGELRREASQFVPELVAECDELAAACAAGRAEAEQRLKTIVDLGRSTDDRIAAAARARAEREQVQRSLAKLGEQAGALTKSTAALVEKLPKVKDARLLAWADQLQALESLAGELRSRRLRGELDTQGAEAAALAGELDEARAATGELPPGRLDELRQRLDTLVDDAWEGEAELQSQLEITARVVGAMKEVGFGAEPVLHERGTTVVTGKSRDEIRLSMRLFRSGDVAWDAEVESDGTKAPACARDLDAVVARALQQGVALTGFYGVDGDKKTKVELPAAREAEVARDKDGGARSKKRAGAKKAAGGAAVPAKRYLTRE